MDLCVTQLYLFGAQVITEGADRTFSFVAEEKKAPLPTGEPAGPLLLELLRHTQHIRPEAS
jgi:hypothetical protein